MDGWSNILQIRERILYRLSLVIAKQRVGDVRLFRSSYNLQRSKTHRDDLVRQRALKALLDNDTVVDADEESVYSHDTEAAYANGNIYTNCANDNSMKSGTPLTSMLVDIDSRRSRVVVVLLTVS
jgi:hypothetical protein